ncbi:MAG: hypothetical protein ACE5JU_11440 [Candidatus Binatia bacterium]
MSKSTRIKSLLATLLLLAYLSPLTVYAGDFIEESGVALGVVVGNLIYVPLKATTMTLALPQGLLSWLLSAGNDQLTEQIWLDNLEGPYLITPALARVAIGKRPEPVGK